MLLGGNVLAGLRGRAGLAGSAGAGKIRAFPQGGSNYLPEVSNNQRP